MATTDYLVNSVYPLSYFALPGVDQIKYPDQYWWSSHQRFAVEDGEQTAEYLEIDMGRVRQINYMSLSILRMPIDIVIAYDAISDTDGTHKWVRVKAQDDMPFDNRIFFDANVKNPWYHARYYFNDALGKPLHTRFLRIAFKRRDHRWPIKKQDPFRWSINVKDMRIARYIVTEQDVGGPLIMDDLGGSLTALTTGQSATRTFSLDSNLRRQSEDTVIDPSIMGFSFLVDAQQVSATYKWTFKVDGIIRRRGTVKGTVNTGKAWMDAYFEDFISTDLDESTQYQISVTNIDGTLSGGAYSEADQLTMRLWGNVGDDGRDVLGNYYRYGAHRDEADYVFDHTKAGWLSAPQPSPEAVEALYFDVRGTDPVTGKPTLTVVDAVRIAPRTPGVRMHVYFSVNNLDADSPPQARDGWDMGLVWEPLGTIYTLSKNDTFVLPKPIAAAYIKLEFSRLQPLPFRLPQHPDLPPVTYHRYPTWIEQEFASVEVRRTVNDWFLHNATPVMRNALKEIREPIQEFQYKEREFLSALALGKINVKKLVNRDLIDKQGNFVDPTTASKIFVSATDLYKGHLLVNIDRSSLLGQQVLSQFDPKRIGDPIEGESSYSNPIGRDVSSPSSRIEESFAYLAQTPLYFHRKAKHKYKVERAEFNKKAYFVGINEVEFLRRDYQVERDDEVISENFMDAKFVADSDFLQEPLSILRKLLDAQRSVTVYLSYVIEDVADTTPPEVVSTEGTTLGDVSLTDDESDSEIVQATVSQDVTDEVVVLAPGSEEHTLALAGSPPINVELWGGPNATGDQYILGTDYDIRLDIDADTGTYRCVLVIPNVPGRFVASQTTGGTEDKGTVIGQASISATEEGPPGTTGNIYTDSGVSRAIASVSALEVYQTGIDTATITALASISGVDLGGNEDSDTVSGIAVITSSETYVPGAAIIDTFNRIESNGWGTADTGQTWTRDQGNASQFSVSSNAGHIALNANNAPINHLDTTDLTYWEYTFGYRFNSNPVGSTQTISPLFWLTDAANHYRCLITQTLSTTTFIRLQQQIANVNTDVIAQTFVTTQLINTWYRAKVRCELVGATKTFYVKVWKESDTEPGSWTAQGNDISGGTKHGFMGMRGQTQAGNTNSPTYDVKDLQVVDLS